MFRISVRPFTVAVVLATVAVMGSGCGATGSDATAPLTPGTTELGTGYDYGTPEPLPIPDGVLYSQPFAISDSGEYILGIADEQMILWHEDGYELIPETFKATDVNSAGLVVGTRDSRPWYYRDGKFGELNDAGVEDGEDVVAVRVNDDEELVATVKVDLDDQVSLTQALRWSSLTAEPERLTGKGAQEITDITANGTIVGINYVDVELGDPDTVSWSADGKPHVLSYPAGESGQRVRAAVDGWVLGETRLWTLNYAEPDFIDLDLDTPVAVDAMGVVFGSHSSQAMQYDREGRHELPLPHGAKAGDVTTGANAVTVDGSVVVGSYVPEIGKPHLPVIWTRK